MLSRNVIRDHLRAHRKGDEIAQTWERIDATLAQTFAAMAERPLPGEVLERAETRDLVHMAIANLPEQYRSALTRKYVDGESLETLARELGISVDAAKSLLARARTRVPRHVRDRLGRALGGCMKKDVLEQNVETLIETGGEPPRIGDAARARIRAELVAHVCASAQVRRSPRAPDRARPRRDRRGGG